MKFNTSKSECRLTNFMKGEIILQQGKIRMRTCQCLAACLVTTHLIATPLTANGATVDKAQMTPKLADALGKAKPTFDPKGHIVLKPRIDWLYIVGDAELQKGNPGTQYSIAPTKDLIVMASASKTKSLSSLDLRVYGSGQCWVNVQNSIYQKLEQIPVSPETFINHYSTASPSSVVFEGAVAAVFSSNTLKQLKLEGQSCSLYIPGKGNVDGKWTLYSLLMEATAITKTGGSLTETLVFRY